MKKTQREFFKGLGWNFETLFLSLLFGLKKAYFSRRVDKGIKVNKYQYST